VFHTVKIVYICVFLTFSHFFAVITIAVFISSNFSVSTRTSYRTELIIMLVPINFLWSSCEVHAIFVRF